MRKIIHKARNMIEKGLTSALRAVHTTLARRERKKKPFDPAVVPSGRKWRLALEGRPSGLIITGIYYAILS